LIDSQLTCECHAGYTHYDCSQDETCPRNCSGHGICRTIDEIVAGNLNNSVAAGSSDFLTTAGGLNRQQVDNYGGSVFYSGVETSDLYRLWDQGMAQSCVCDPGFSGPDCSNRECPRGDDPLTHRMGDCPFIPVFPGGVAGDVTSAWNTQPCNNEIQTIEISGTVAGKADWFHFLYKDWTGKIWKTDDFLIGGNGLTACTANAALPVAADGTVCSAFTAGTPNTCTAYTTRSTNVIAAIKNALKSIPNGIISDVTITDSPAYAPTGETTGTYAHGYVLDITFTKNPGNQQALTLVNSAEMQLRLPVCISGDTGKDFGVARVVYEKDGNTELSTCSNRGVCDYTSGLCKCFKGYYGGDCSNQNALAQ